MPRNLYVAELSHLVDEDELGRLFGRHGTVRAAHVFDSLATANPTVTGLVEMDTERHGEAAISAIDGMHYRGHALRVCWAKRGQDAGVPPSPMLSVKIPRKGESPVIDEPRGPRRGDFGDRGGN